MGADPFTMMAIASAASGIVSGIGAGKAGAANQAIHNRNAEILRMRANEFVSAANQQADLERDKNKRVLAQGAVKYLKGGVEMAGSPVEVLGEMAANIEYDAQLTKHKGRIQAWEAETEAANQEYLGAMAKWRGKQQKRAAFLGAAFSAAGAAYGSFGGSMFKASPGQAFNATGGFTGLNTSGIGFFDTMKYGVSKHPGLL